MMNEKNSNLIHRRDQNVKWVVQKSAKVATTSTLLGNRSVRVEKVSGEQKL